MESPEIPRSPPRVGLLYDERMCRHTTPDGEQHPECPQRIRAIWKKLEAEGIPRRCVVLNSKCADEKHLASVHTKKHIDLIRRISSKEFDSRRSKIASKFNSIYFNNGSSEAAYLAAGSVVEASVRVARGELNSAVAIVRPPGHHAESNEAMGFCLFNNVAIAANVLLDKRQELGIKKILIVDWDVHHGNGTQKAFYDDPRVLFFSVHRFDFGSFYPTGGDGALCMTGEDAGAGYNINVPWEHGRCGDADYFAVWDHVLIPVAEAYNPDIILISAGFDAAIGDPLGGCCISPFGYSVMLRKLMRFAGGKIVMALEGGYNLNSISNSVVACVNTLLEEKYIAGFLEDRPFKSTWSVILEVRNELKTFWPILSVELPQNILISNNQPLPVETDHHSNLVAITIKGEPDVVVNLVPISVEQTKEHEAEPVTEASTGYATPTPAILSTATSPTAESSLSTTPMPLTIPITPMSEVGSSSDREDLEDELIMGLIGCFFRKLEAFVAAVFQGRSTPTEALKRSLLFSVKSIQVISSDARVESLLALTEDFGKYVDQWRHLRQADLSPQIQEELNCLQALNQKKLEEASQQMEALKEDLGRINTNVIRIADSTHFTEQKIISFKRNIDSARRTIVKAQALLAQTEPALAEETGKLTVLNAMSTQLQREAQNKTKELEELDVYLAQQISLKETVLKEQAVATARENQRLQLAALEDTLRSFSKRQL